MGGLVNTRNHLEMYMIYIYRGWGGRHSCPTLYVCTVLYKCTVFQQVKSNSKILKTFQAWQEEQANQIKNQTGKSYSAWKVLNWTAWQVLKAS